jgi:predicted signal transduction protein with EAL and GGDEF domain
MVARMGGDEFAVIFPNTHKGAANKLLAKLLNVLTKNMLRNHWPITFSIGAVTFRTPPESVHEMIQRADEIMYSLKESGKTRAFDRRILLLEEKAGILKAASTCSTGVLVSVLTDVSAPTCRPATCWSKVESAETCTHRER